MAHYIEVETLSQKSQTQELAGPNMGGGSTAAEITLEQIDGLDAENVQAAVEELYNEKQNVIPANTYDAYGAATAVQTNLDEVTALIPNQASASNQLADKDFVNSTVGTNTAIFRGTFESVAELEAYSGAKTNNDYAFVIIYDETVPTQVIEYDRYKYNGSAWVFEFALNNSSFTAAQWAAIQSGITAELVGKIGQIGLIDPARIIYIKLDDGDATEGQSWSSDCECIKTKNANILIDFGRIQDYSRIKNALLENGVTRIDYIFLSHFHHDHCGCLNYNKVGGDYEQVYEAGTSLSTLWDDSDFDTDNCVLVLPVKTTLAQTQDEPKTMIRIIEDFIEDNGITYGTPTAEGVYWNVKNAVLGELPAWTTSKPATDGVIIRAHNCTAAQLNGYDTTNYNEHSIVLEIELGYTLATFTGDSSVVSQTALKSVLRQTDILKLGHHMTDADWDEGFYEKLNPRYAVASVDMDIYENYMKSLIVDAQHERPAIKWLAYKKIPIYPLAVSDTCIFESNGEAFRLVSNNRNFQPKATAGALLWSGVAAPGDTIDMSGTGWRSYSVYKVLHAASGTALLATLVQTTDGEFFRGIGGSARTSSPQYPITAQISCAVSGDVITVITSSISSHLQTSSYHSINSTPNIVAIYGIA